MENENNYIEEYDSWSKVESKKGLIARKKIDKSFIKQGGSGIPRGLYNDFTTIGRINDNKLKIDIKLIYQGSIYKGNILRKKSGRVWINIKDDVIKKKLPQLFKQSMEYIKKQEPTLETTKKYVIVPDDRAEYVEFYETDEEDVYEMKFIIREEEEIRDRDDRVMTYEKERTQLEELLLQNLGETILNKGQEILELVPELIVCAQCEHGNPAHLYNVFEHTLHVVAGVEADLKLKLAALLHDIGKPYVKTWYEGWFRYGRHPEVSVTLSKLILKRLGYSADFIEDVTRLVEYHDGKIPPEKENIQEMLTKLGKENFERLLLLQYSDISAHEATYAKRTLEKLNEVKTVYATFF